MANNGGSPDWLFGSQSPDIWNGYLQMRLQSRLRILHALFSIETQRSKPHNLKQINYFQESCIFATLAIIFSTLKDDNKLLKLHSIR